MLLVTLVWSRRSWFVAVVVGLSTFVGSRLFLNEERAVERVIRELAEGAEVRRGELPGAREARLQRLLSQTIREPLSVQARDLPSVGTGKSALLRWGGLLGHSRSAELEVIDLQIHVDGDDAVAQSEVTLTASSEMGQWSDRRSVQWHLSKVDDVWKVRAIDIGRRPNDKPEARP